MERVSAQCFSISCRNQCNFGFFGLNLVAMATALASLKIQIAYLNSPTSKTLLFMQKNVLTSCTELKSVHFGPFLPKFGCHGNSLCPLENADSIFVSADHENPTIHAKSVSIWCTDLKLVQFWLILPEFGCHGKSLSSVKIQIAYFNSQTPKTLLFTGKISR